MSGADGVNVTVFVSASHDDEPATAPDGPANDNDGVSSRRAGEDRCHGRCGIDPRRTAVGETDATVGTDRFVLIDDVDEVVRRLPGVRGESAAVGVAPVARRRRSERTAGVVGTKYPAVAA